MQVIQLPRVTSRNLSAFSLGFSFYIIYKVDELGFKELLALIHEMVKFLLFLLKNLLLRTHHIRDLVLDITGLNELWSKRIIVKKLPSKPRKFSHDFQEFRLCFRILVTYFLLILLFLVVEPFQSFVLSDGLSQSFFIFRNNTPLSLNGRWMKIWLILLGLILLSVHILLWCTNFTRLEFRVFSIIYVIFKIWIVFVVGNPHLLSSDSLLLLFVKIQLILGILNPVHCVRGIRVPKFLLEDWQIVV